MFSTQILCPCPRTRPNLRPSQRTTRQPHQPTSSERPPTLPDILPPAPSRDHNSRSCPRHPRMSPNPLRLFQSSPAHSWRCDSFQRTSTSSSTRPVPQASQMLKLTKQAKSTFPPDSSRAVSYKPKVPQTASKAPATPPTAQNENFNDNSSPWSMTNSFGGRGPSGPRGATPPWT